MRFPEDVPVLTDGVVTLRAHTEDDIDGAYAMCQDPEMQRWTTIPIPYTREHAVHFLTQYLPAGWRDGGFWGWAIEYDGKFAGTIDLSEGEGGMGQVGFSLAPWARGNGVMTRAVKLVVRHAFDVFGWERVIWKAIAGNWASRRVAWKAGFRGLVTVPGGLSRGVRKDDWVASIGRDDELEPQGNWWSVPVLEGGGIR
jgi:RimJ/RimL family protein N-acetyltransferase